MARGQKVNQFTGVGTPMIPWTELRSILLEDAAALANFAANPHGLDFASLEPEQYIDLQEVFASSFATGVFAFYAKDNGAGEGLIVDNDYCGFELLGYRESGGDPILICGTALTTGLVVGTMETTADSEGNALTAGTAYWIDTILLDRTDSVGRPLVFESSNNRIAMLQMDLWGMRYLYPRFAGMSNAEAGEIPSIVMIGTVY